MITSQVVTPTDPWTFDNANDPKELRNISSANTWIGVLWGWLYRHRQAKKAREFRLLLNEVSRLDEEAMRREESGAVTVDELLRLRGQLAQLRSSVLDRFATGELADNELLSSFLALVNSSRDNLTRLIAQHRHLSRQSPAGAYDPVASVYGPAEDSPEPPDATRERLPRQQ